MTRNTEIQKLYKRKIVQTRIQSIFRILITGRRSKAEPKKRRVKDWIVSIGFFSCFLHNQLFNPVLTFMLTWILIMSHFSKFQIVFRESFLRLEHVCRKLNSFNLDCSRKHLVLTVIAMTSRFSNTKNFGKNISSCHIWESVRFAFSVHQNSTDNHILTVNVNVKRTFAMPN